MGDSLDMYLNQVAISTRRGLDEAARWYVDGLGFLPAGGTAFAGPDIAEVQGIDAPNVDLEMCWFVDRNDFMQIEYFRYSEPETRPLPQDWSPADAGYNVVGVHVTSFDETLARLADLGTRPIGATVGDPGDRRACVKDPSGALIELMERDVAAPGRPAPPRPEVNVAIRFIRATVPDLDKARRFFVDTVGLTPVPTALHRPEHEALWGLEGAVSTTQTLLAGNAFVELVQYEGRGRDWPEGYRISDEGILNIAFGSLAPEPFLEARGRAAAGPYRIHRSFVVPPELEVNYVTDDQGFNVELMYMGPAMHADFGFVPAVADRG